VNSHARRAADDHGPGRRPPCWAFVDPAHPTGRRLGSPSRRRARSRGGRHRAPHRVRPADGLGPPRPAPVSRPRLRVWPPEPLGRARPVHLGRLSRPAMVRAGMSATSRGPTGRTRALAAALKASAHRDRARPRRVREVAGPPVTPRPAHWRMSPRSSRSTRRPAETRCWTGRGPAAVASRGCACGSTGSIAFTAVLDPCSVDSVQTASRPAARIVATVAQRTSGTTLGQWDRAGQRRLPAPWRRTASIVELSEFTPADAGRETDGVTAPARGWRPMGFWVNRRSWGCSAPLLAVIVVGVLLLITKGRDLVDPPVDQRPESTRTTSDLLADAGPGRRPRRPRTSACPFHSTDRPLVA